MLTFFDYLRRRSYESIVAGVHEALESLERDEHAEATSTEKSPQLSARAPIVSTTEPKHREPDDTTPPPRRRGRPPKKKARNA